MKKPKLTLEHVAQDMLRMINMIEDLEKKLSLMGATQSALIDTVAEDNPVFMRKLMAKAIQMVIQEKSYPFKQELLQ